MTEWSILLMETPAKTAADGTSGLVAPLRLWSGLQLTASVTDIASCSFTVPLRHWQTALIKQGVSDLLLYRDDVVVQRFRVTALTIASAAGVGTVAVTGSSYREVVNGWFFHDSDHLNYGTNPGDTTGHMEQTLLAWNVLSEGQAKANGNVVMTRGTTPTTSHNVNGYASSGTEPFFKPGEPRGSAIQSKLADASTLTGSGFEWDLEPDPANPMRALLFNTWNYGQRNYHAGANSPLVLTEAAMANWQVQASMAQFANVMRVQGGGTTTPVYVPGDDPAGTPPQGRWELSNDQSTIVDQTQLTAWAAYQAQLNSVFQEVWTVTLEPGVWGGPTQCWLGDSCRLLLAVDTTYEDGTTATPVLDRDQPLRVLSLSIAVDTSGAEVVQLNLNREPVTFPDFIDNVNSRLTTLERYGLA